MENRVLKVVQVGEEQESKDERRFKTIGVIPDEQEGVISTHRIHKRNIWNRGPLGGEYHPYYENIQEGSRILGRIETLPTKEYYIPNDRGRFVTPDGQRVNKATTKTYIPFEDETAEQMRRNDGLDPQQSAQDSRQIGTYITDIEVTPLQGEEAPEEQEAEESIT